MKKLLILVASAALLSACSPGSNQGGTGNETDTSSSGVNSPQGAATNKIESPQGTTNTTNTTKPANPSGA